HCSAWCGSAGTSWTRRSLTCELRCAWLPNPRCLTTISPWPFVEPGTRRKPIPSSRALARSTPLSTRSRRRPTEPRPAPARYLSTGKARRRSWRHVDEGHALSARPLGGLLLLGVLTVLWGSNWPAMKLALRELDPWTFRTICLLVGGGGLLTLVR